MSVAREGFSEAVETVIVERADQALDVPLRLEVGSVAAAVVVTASRAERDVRQIPLHVESITRAAVEQTNQLSTGDALTMAAKITPVGNGPFGVRPRLRGLDSTRLLVLVDGERLNTARQATDRTGAEVGLVSPDAISRMEVVNGAGTLMYGSDALAGTINIITNEASFTPQVRWLYGFNGFYSTNENGCAARAQSGVTAPNTPSASRQARKTTTTTGPATSIPRTRGPCLRRARWTRPTRSMITSASGSTRSRTVQRAVRADRQRSAQLAGRGNFVNVSGSIKVGERRSVRVRYQRRRMEDVGFPDFAAPYSSTRRRCRTATWTVCRHATKRRP